MMNLTANQLKFFLLNLLTKSWNVCCNNYNEVPGIDVNNSRIMKTRGFGILIPCFILASSHRDSLHQGLSLYLLLVIGGQLICMGYWD